MSDERNTAPDPPRWADDADAPRAYRGDEWAALAPPPMPRAVHDRVRGALAARSRRRPMGRWVLALVAAAGVVAALVWRRAPRSARSPVPAPVVVRPEPVATGPTTTPASTPTSSPGPAPVPAPAPVASDAGHVSSVRPRPREGMPYVRITGNGCGLEVHVPLSALDNDVASVALVLVERPLADMESGPVAVDCSGALVREIDGAVFRAGARAATPGVSLSVNFVLGPPTTRCDASYTLAVCGRDRAGLLSVVSSEPAWPARTANDGQSEAVEQVATPSGLTVLGDVMAGHTLYSLVVAPHAGTTTDVTAPPTPVEVRVVAVRPWDATPSGVTELRLATGRVARLGSTVRVWLTNRQAFVPASEVRAGDSALGDDGPVAVRGTIALPEQRAATTLDVSWPDAFLLDGVLVHDDGGESAATAPAPRTPALAEAVRAVPAHSSGCSLRTELEVASLPAGADSVAVMFTPDREPAGRLVPMRCDAATQAAELPRALLEQLPEREPGRRVLSLEVETGWSYRGRRPVRVSPVVECETPYAVLACVREAGGALRSLPGAQGRWALSGPTCLAAGTPVATREGARPIERLRPGMEVITRDPFSGALVVETVRSLIPRGVRAVLALSLANGATLRATAEHPFYDARTRAFRPAGTLRAGDVLLGAGGEEVQLLASVDTGEKVPVFDLSVSGLHTYLAGGVLVHNY